MDPLTIVSQTLPPAVAKAAYNFQVKAIGGTLPYVWSVVPGFGLLNFGVLLVGDTLVAAAGDIPETAVGMHTFRLRVVDAALNTQTVDLSITVEPADFTKAHAFLLDERLFQLIQTYLVAGATREKVELHFFRNIVSTVATNFMHLDEDILVPNWPGMPPYPFPKDVSLRTVLDEAAGDLMYFAEPNKSCFTVYTPGPGILQGNVVITPASGFFVGRHGETDATMARHWFKPVMPDSEDEPHDGNGNPLVVVRVEDAVGVEIDPNANAYQVDLDGFHTGKDGGGATIGYGLKIIFEYVPNPSMLLPKTPFCFRYGIRKELHDMAPESFIQFGNVVGDIDADIIALINTAPYVRGIRVGPDVVKVSSTQEIEFLGQDGIEIDPDPSAHRLIFSSTGVRTINETTPDGSGDLDLDSGEFIEVETEVSNHKLIIKTSIPVHEDPGTTPPTTIKKGLISGEDYAKILELVSKRLTRLHKHTGEDVRCGLPKDGSFADGFIPMDQNEAIVQTFDRLNEALLASLGPSVTPLDDVELTEVANIAPRTGFLAADIGAIGPVIYEGGGPGPGVEADYVYNYSANLAGAMPFVVETAVEFGAIVPGDSLVMMMNGVVIETWILPGPVIVGPSPMLIATAGMVGMQITSLRVVGASTIIKASLYADPTNAAIAPPGPMVLGYNYFELQHVQPGPITHTSAAFKVFLDPTLPVSGGPYMPTSISVRSTGPTEYMSGVKYFVGDNEALLSFSVPNVAWITYLKPPFEIRVNNPAGTYEEYLPIRLDDPSVSGLSNPPDISETMTVADFESTYPLKNLSIHVGAFGDPPWIQLQHTRPGVQVIQPQGPPIFDPSGNTLLYSLSKAMSSNMVECFEHEKYRLNPYDRRWGGPDFHYIPMMIRDTFGWVSDNALTPGSAPYGDGGGVPGSLQVNPLVAHGPAVLRPGEGALIWPSGAYSSGAFNPTQAAGRDYNVLFAPVMAANYVRAFVFRNDPKEHGTLRILGITSANIGLSYLGSGGAPAGNVNLEIKFPGNRTNFHSGWMDLAKLATGDFNDGDGARWGFMRDVVLPDGLNSVEIDWTGNGLSTRYSGEVLILRVTYRSPAIQIFEIEEIG